MDFVRYWLAVDWVSDSGVLDLEGSVGVGVEVVAAGGFEEGFLCEVTGAVGVEV